MFWSFHVYCKIDALGLHSHIPAFTWSLFKEAADINCCLIGSRSLRDTYMYVQHRQVRGLGYWVSIIYTKVGDPFVLVKTNILKSSNTGKYHSAKVTHRFKKKNLWLKLLNPSVKHSEQILTNQIILAVRCTETVVFQLGSHFLFC